MLLLVLAIASNSCKKELPATATVERKDGYGRTVRLPPPERIQRILSLAPSSTEILFAIGAGSKVVGVDRYSDFPPAAAALPKVGGDVDPSFERMVALKPDVVFTNTSANTQATAETLERLGLPVYVSRDGALEDIYRDIGALGEVTGHNAQAAEVVAAMKARIAAVGARRANAPPVGALVVVWSDPLTVAGTRSHVGDLLRAAGGANVAADSTVAFPVYSLERVVAHPPEVMIVGTHSTGSPPLGPLQELAAKLGPRAFRVVTVDGDLLFRPGPRVADGVETLDRLLHPTGSPP
jgi:iron complex transport system substrate-binding protein